MPIFINKFISCLYRRMGKNDFNSIDNWKRNFDSFLLSAKKNR